MVRPGDEARMAKMRALERMLDLPDAARPGMWRVRRPDGRVSDITNLTRAKDAVACSIETEGRRQRGRHSPSEGRLCVKTILGKGRAAE
jgi:hypothetical protein